MQESLVHLEKVSSELETDRLYAWISSSRHADARRHYDNFIPILGFILTFPYYNDQYLAYPEQGIVGGAPPTQDAAIAALRAVINEHAKEDRTHARLFLHDVRTLDMAKVWGIEKPSTALWTLFVSPMLDAGQAVLHRRIKTLIQDTDAWPPFRYLHIEQIEQDGHLLFTASSSKGPEIAKQTGVTPKYFAAFHLERESGHVGGGEFENVALTPEQAEHAKHIITQKHAASVAMNDIMYRFAAEAEAFAQPGQMLVAEQERCLGEVKRRVAAHAAGEIPAPHWSIRPDGFAEQSDLVAAWHRHHATFVDHPFSKLFREAEGEEADRALRTAALLLSCRISSLHSFYRLDCVSESTGPEAEVVRFVGEAFSTEAQLFLHDWNLLGMDEHIPWDLADLLEWMFFDPTYGKPEMEALHEFRREALRTDEPVMKYWALMSIHFMSRAFFGSARAVAERYAARHPDKAPLVYFEGIHHLLYESSSANWLDPSHPTSLAHMPVTPEQRQRILAMMDTFERLGRRQFDNLVRALTTDRKKFDFLASR
jgi:hypothetical protein